MIYDVIFKRIKIYLGMLSLVLIISYILNLIYKETHSFYETFGTLFLIGSFIAICLIFFRKI
jgi:hypothetical protein